MDLPTHMFSSPVHWLANVLMVLLVGAAAWRAPLSRLRNNEFTHVFSAACVVLLVLWNTRVGVLPALNFHLLGVTTVTLMFGWRYAVIGVLMVSVGTMINQQGDWSGLGLNVLVTGCLPILVTQALLGFARRRLPYNFFVYVYINGFLAAGLSFVAVGLAGALLMMLVDPASHAWLSYQYYPFFPLVFFSEALLNGMMVTALVALRPGWICSFDDNLYLKDK